ncbi:MAG: 1-acyl-sn-glycerol-3-phosphate acyltransferase [Saprospiraceae bacterium]|nr:1-acyl-sn-glycerol-3-phosphate acyltransferase [Saprospiraceae bacterium]
MGQEKPLLFPTSHPVRLLTYLVFTVFVWFYRIRKIMPREVRNQKSPYLLLSNHVGYWDPFLIGHLLPRFTHFVSSDAAFKTRLTRFFLPRLGAIPIQKNVRDTRAVRAIAGVIRQGDNVGLFPEAVRNWDGTTLPIDPSIGKLVKMLQVPVIGSVSRGMNLFNPRWSKKVRRTHLEIEYQLLLDREEIRHMDPAAIHRRIVSALQHDEVDYQRVHRHPIRSRRRAEHINHTLFLCPACAAIDSFDVRGNEFWCTSCSHHLHIDPYGFFQLKHGDQLYFDNIRDWYRWQEGRLAVIVRQHLISGDPGWLFRDENSLVYGSRPDADFTLLGRADVCLYSDRVELYFPRDGHTIRLAIRDLLTINPQVHEKLEISYPGAVYRCIGGRPGVSGLKWEVAVNVIWKEMGQMQKLSPYIKV